MGEQTKCIKPPLFFFIPLFSEVTSFTGEPLIKIHVVRLPAED